MESANTVPTESSPTNLSTLPSALKNHSVVTIAFCGGGSGGHLTPSIALARAWVSENPNVRFQFLFLCSGRTIDRTILDTAQLSNCDVKVVAQTATTSSQKLALLNCLRKDFTTCRTILKQYQPDIILGTGGFASVAPILAARWLGFRTVLLELNAVPGKATRWLSHVSTLVWSGWPMNRKTERSVKAIVVPLGIPISQPAVAAEPPDHISRQPDSPTLMIAGGSLGASRLNDIVCDALAENRDQLKHWNIEHQTGPSWQPSSTQIESCVALNWNRHTFIPNLAQQFQTADVVISRAGAVSLAEIASACVASILVPLSTSADGHQTANAKAFEAVGAAFIVDELQPSASTSLSASLSQLVANDMTRLEMKNSCKKLHCHIISNNASEVLMRLLQDKPAN